VDIAAKSAGRLRDVLVREGDLVSAGQIVARIDTTELLAQRAKYVADQTAQEASMLEAQAAVAQRQAELTLKEASRRRLLALAKVWANGVVIVAAFVCSLLFVVEGVLAVPIAGSHGLLLLGTVIYVFAAAAIGIFLGMLARTMAQFALLMLMVIFPMMILSGGMLPVESQPQWVQYVTWLLPSRHYLAIVQAIAIRGAEFTIVWQEFLTILVMGGMFLTASLFLFRRSIATA